MAGSGARRACRGMTMVELMVVIGLIGVGSAVAVPSTTAYLSLHRETALVHEVAAELEIARAEARAQLRCVKLEVDSAANALLRTPVDCATLAALPGTSPMRRVYSTAGGRLMAWVDAGGGMQPHLVFARDGSTTASSVTSVRVQTSRGNRHVHVWPAVGTVRVD